MDLILAKEVVSKLKQGGAADISVAYFSQLVTMGVIPFHVIPGKKRKLFYYDEAKRALLENQDPTRDAQRDANKREKETKKLNEKAKEYKELNEKYLKAFSFDQQECFSETLERLKPIVLNKKEQDILYNEWNTIHLENSNIIEVIEELFEIEKTGGYIGMNSKQIHNFIISKFVKVLNDGSDLEAGIEEHKENNNKHSENT